MSDQVLPIAIAIAATVLGIAFILALQSWSQRSRQQKEVEVKIVEKPHYALGPQTDSGNMAINALAIKLRAQIISTRWFSEMLLYKQQGKLNFAQMEMLHQINKSCRESCKLLNEMFDAVNTQVPNAISPEALAPEKERLDDSEQPMADLDEPQLA